MNRYLLVFLVAMLMLLSCSKSNDSSDNDGDETSADGDESDGDASDDDESDDDESDDDESDDDESDDDESDDDESDDDESDDDESDDDESDDDESDDDESDDDESDDDESDDDESDDDESDDDETDTDELGDSGSETGEGDSDSVVTGDTETGSDDTESMDTHTSDTATVDTESEDSGIDTVALTEDRDSDGFTPNDGDCNDDEPLINPNALEVSEAVSDTDDTDTVELDTAVDNDCDGEYEDFAVDCDDTELGNDPLSLAAAMNLCDDRFLLSATRIHSASNIEKAYGTSASLGTNDCLVPRQGAQMALLGTGPMDSPNPNKNMPLDTDVSFLHTPVGCPEDYPDPQPLYQNDTLSEAPDDSIFICDVTQLRLELRAPANATGFSFDFIFASAEYNEWVNQGYNDTFYAILEYDSVNSGATTNISFDAYGNEIEVDSNFFENASFTCDETGTGWTPAIEDVSGSTGWLRTTWALAAPGDMFTLTLSIHDEGDATIDSAVFLDNFQWITQQVEIVQETVPIVLE